MPRDLRNLNEALEELDSMSIRTPQGSVVKTEDVKRLFKERVEVLTTELEEHRVPYRMPADRARRMAMRDEDLREAHKPAGLREPGRSVPAGPIASEGVKS